MPPNRPYTSLFIEEGAGPVTNKTPSKSRDFRQQTQRKTRNPNLFCACADRPAHRRRLSGPWTVRLQGWTVRASIWFPTPSISVVAVSGGEGNRTIRLWATLHCQQVLILVDSGSSASFMGDHFVGAMTGVQLMQPPVQVKVADGGMLWSTHVVPNC
jgi:hypothetical protein